MSLNCTDELFINIFTRFEYNIDLLCAILLVSQCVPLNYIRYNTIVMHIAELKMNINATRTVKNSQIAV